MDLNGAVEPAASDQSLVNRAIAGERAAFGQLVRRYERLARATALAVLRDHHLAADAAQEAFVAAYRSLAGLRDRSAFGAWLTTIARNRAVRVARDRRPESPLPELLEKSAVDESTDAGLLDVVASLPEHERVVVMLRYFEGHDIATIAGILSRPVGTVTKQLSRAHERLRRALSQEDER